MTYHVFFSQPMHGLKDEEIYTVCRRVGNKLLDALGDDVRIIPVNSIERPGAPQNAGRLWYLGEAIKNIERCDFMIFCDGWESFNGCQVEMMIARQYGVPHITEYCINNHNIHDFNKGTLDRMLNNYNWRRRE